MPAFLKTPKDEKIWSYKKKQVAKQTGKKESEFTDTEWRRVNFLFQKAKAKYSGRKLPKKYSGASFKEMVVSAYQIKPIEHFNSGSSPFWSIQTERTHGRKGIITVSKSQLEDPAMSIQTRPDYLRVAGAEDIFQGSKEGLMAYIKARYKDFTAIEFKTV